MTWILILHSVEQVWIMNIFRIMSCEVLTRQEQDAINSWKFCAVKSVILQYTIVRELMSGNRELCRNLFYYKFGMRRAWISWTTNITSNYAYHGDIKTMSGIVFSRWVWHQNFSGICEYGPTLTSAFTCSIRNIA